MSDGSYATLSASLVSPTLWKLPPASRRCSGIAFLSRWPRGCFTHLSPPPHTPLTSLTHLHPTLSLCLAEWELITCRAKLQCINSPSLLFLDSSEEDFVGLCVYLLKHTDSPPFSLLCLPPSCTPYSPSFSMMCTPMPVSKHLWCPVSWNSCLWVILSPWVWVEPSDFCKNIIWQQW